MEPVRWRQPAPDASISSKVPHSYLLEHLATFSGVSKQGSLLSPEDGMRQLRQMALTQGHWVLRVRLLVKPQHLVIIDAGSGEEMEIIAVNIVRQLTAFTNPSTKETYNNVLLFTTMDATNAQSITEMHIFQCLDESAEVIVDDINSAKANRQRDSVSYPKQPEDWQKRTQEYEAAAKRTANAIGAFDPTSQSGQIRRNIQRGGSDSSQYIMDGVELLNHCFDDIEQFMNQLQKVADAYKELEYRRRGSNKKDQFTGGGMITLRVRNPSQQAFVDIFQKFKLSFNLLAKLKPYIHDPNAPELVHFLFTPLGLVVEASSDQRLGPGGVVSTVTSPLLSSEALELLRNCLNSKEMELHRRLGDAWTISKDTWRGYVPPYIPRFYDGWNPPMEWIDDAAQQVGMGDSRRPSEAPTVYLGNSGVVTQRTVDHVAPADIYAMPQKSNSRTSPKSSLVNGDDGQTDKSFLRELLSKNAPIYQVIQSRKSDKKQELSLEKGEILEVLDNSRQWWKVRNSKGQTGFAPNTLLQPYSIG